MEPPAFAMAWMRRARVVEALLKARLEVDLPGLVAGVRARLTSRLQLQAIPVEADLADRAGPLGWGRVQTWAWSAPRLRKVVLSHVSMRPIIEGFALVLSPESGYAAPVFAADLMALPTRVSANADQYGVRHAPFQASLRGLGESFVRLETSGGPAWGADLASGVGLHTKLSPRMTEGAFAALSAALGSYLDTLDGLSTHSTTPEADELARQKFFQLFHEHGPRRGPLGRLFGAAWAERYSHLVFE